MSRYVSICQDVSGYVRICQDLSGCVRMCKARQAKEGRHVPKGKRFGNREDSIIERG